MEPNKEDMKWRINASLKMVEIFVLTGLLLSIIFLTTSMYLNEEGKCFIINTLFLFLFGALLLLLITAILYIRVDRYIFKKSKKWKWY